MTRAFTAFVLVLALGMALTVGVRDAGSVSETGLIYGQDYSVSATTPIPVPAGGGADNSANAKFKLSTVGARANASAPAWTEGNQVPLSVDLSGNLRTTATLTASTVTANQGTPNTLANGWPVKLTDGTNSASVDSAGNVKVVPKASTGTFIKTATTTTVKSGAGVLDSVCITQAWSATPTVTIYDNTAGSGTVLATIDSTSLGCYPFGFSFSTGLTVVTAGTPGSLSVGTQ